MVNTTMTDVSSSPGEVELLPATGDPRGHGDKVCHEGGDAALEQGVVAQDDVAVVGLRQVPLRHHCGEKGCPGTGGGTFCGGFFWN